MENNPIYIGDIASISPTCDLDSNDVGKTESTAIGDSLVNGAKVNGDDVVLLAEITEENSVDITIADCIDNDAGSDGDRSGFSPSPDPSSNENIVGEIVINLAEGIDAIANSAVQQVRLDAIQNEFIISKYIGDIYAK